MRDLRDRPGTRRRRPRPARPHVRDAPPSRARLGGGAPRRPRRHRRPAAGDHRPHRGKPADRRRGRHRRRRPERGDLQLPRADGRAAARRPHLPDALRHRGARPRLRGVGRPALGAPARHVRGRRLGRAQPAARARARPLRDQAAVLPARRRRAVVRLRARRARPRRHRPRRRRGVPRVQLDPGAALDLLRHPEAAAGTHPDLAGRKRCRPRATRGPARCRHGTARTRRSSWRNAAHACATRCARTSSPTCRSGCSSPAASTPERSPPSPPRSRAKRCAPSRSASRRARSTSCRAPAPSPHATARSTASSSCAPTQRSCCRRSPTRSTSRSPTRRHSPPTSSRSWRPRT